MMWGNRGNMKKLNPIYLWYSVILLFPPVHEWGHVMIAWLTGSKVIAMHWFYISIKTDSIFHHLWEYSPLVVPICIIVWGELFLRELGLSFFKRNQKVKDES
jgi:hypothetical protein